MHHSVSAADGWVQRAQWLAIGLIAWLLLVILSMGWLHTALGPRLDQALASPLIHWPPWWLRSGLSTLARPWLVLTGGAFAVVLMGRALWNRRWTAVLAGILVPLACLSGLSELRHGWLGLGNHAFPSGHAVAGFAVLGMLAILAPAGWAAHGWWRVVWVAGVLVVAVGNVTLHAHLPGDVISAALLVTAVTGVVLGILPPRPVWAGSGAGRGTMGQL